MTQEQINTYKAMAQNRAAEAAKAESAKVKVPLTGLVTRVVFFGADKNLVHYGRGDKTVASRRAALRIKSEKTDARGFNYTAEIYLSAEEFNALGMRYESATRVVVFSCTVVGDGKAVAYPKIREVNLTARDAVTGKRHGTATDVRLELNEPGDGDPMPTMVDGKGTTSAASAEEVDLAALA